MKLYTKSGDDGTTGLLFGGRASKAGPRTDAYGAIDTAISAMGMARALSSDERVKDILLRCQHDMFTAATEVAVDPAHYDLLIENFSPVTEGMVERLEGWIDDSHRRGRPAAALHRSRSIGGVGGHRPGPNAHAGRRAPDRRTRGVGAASKRQRPAVRQPPLRPAVHPRPLRGQGPAVRDHDRGDAPGRGLGASTGLRSP